MTMPAAMPIEVFPARHLDGNVADGLVIALLAIITGHPGSEVIVPYRLPLVVRRHVRALHPHLGMLPGRNHQFTVARLEAHFATPGSGMGGIFCHIDAEVTAPRRLQATVRRVHCDLSRHIALGHPQGQRPRVQAQDDGFVVEPHPVQIGLPSQPERG
jgi:hypothetical protein